MLIAKIPNLLLHPTWSCSGTSHICEISSKNSRLRHDLLLLKMIIFNTFSVRNFHTVNQLCLSVKSLIFWLIIVIFLLLIFWLLGLVSERPFIISQMETIIENAHMLLIDLWRANNFNICALFRLHLGASHAAQLTNMLCHIFFCAILLHNEHTTMLLCVNPVVLRQSQVLPEVQLLIERLKAFKASNFRLIN